MAFLTKFAGTSFVRTFKQVFWVDVNGHVFLQSGRVRRNKFAKRTFQNGVFPDVDLMKGEKMVRVLSTIVGGILARLLGAIEFKWNAVGVRHVIFERINAGSSLSACTAYVGLNGVLLDRCFIFLVLLFSQAIFPMISHSLLGGKLLSALATDDSLFGRNSVYMIKMIFHFHFRHVNKIAQVANERQIDPKIVVVVE